MTCVTVVVVWAVGAMCVVQFIRLCDCVVQPSSRTAECFTLMGIRATCWRQGCCVPRGSNLHIFSSYFTRHVQTIFRFFSEIFSCSSCSCALNLLKKVIDVWTSVAWQLFAQPQHIPCCAALLYEVIRPKFCSYGRTFRIF